MVGRGSLFLRSLACSYAPVQRKNVKQDSIREMRNFEITLLHTPHAMKIHIKQFASKFVQANIFKGLWYDNTQTGNISEKSEAKFGNLD